MVAVLMGLLNGGASCGMYLTTHSASAVSSIPSKGVSKWKVERSEVTFSCIALARARVIGPLGGLGGLEEGVSVGHPVSAPPLGKESSSTLRHLLLGCHDMERGPSH